MTKTQANKYLARACKRGYVPYHSGIVRTESQGRDRVNWGISVDGDGHGRLFGCPKIIWCVEQAEENFPVIAR